MKPPATEDEPERRTSFKDLSLDSETTNTLRQIDTKPKLITSVPPPSIPLTVPSPSILKKSIPKPDPKPTNEIQYDVGAKYDAGFGALEYVSPIRSH